MMFVNLIWAWGHPEVYILVLPAFGIFSEVFSTFSGKPLFGYRSMVAATLFICVRRDDDLAAPLLHDGRRRRRSTPLFGISTSIIAVGTGVKIYNWIFTMYGGRVRFDTPMLWSMGFIFTFVIGGMTGVLLAVPPADFLVHNSMFLVAHFHNVIVGGVVFGALRRARVLVPQGLRLPAARGLGQGRLLVRLHRLLGDLHAALHGRHAGHDAAPAAHRFRADGGRGCWSPRLGVGILIIGAICQVTQLVVSIRQREQPARRDRRSLGRPLAGVGHALAAARSSTSPSCPTSRARRPTGASSSARSRPSSWARAGLRADRDAAQQLGRASSPPSSPSSPASR